MAADPMFDLRRRFTVEKYERMRRGEKLVPTAIPGLLLAAEDVLGG